MKKYTELKEAEQKLLQGAEQKLLQKLEQEQAAGIPSIPEGLKPENIGQLLEKAPEKEVTNTRINWKSVRAVSGGMAAIAALLFIVCIPRFAMGGGSKSDCATGAAMEMAQEAVVETKAASAAVTEDAESELRPTGCSPESALGGGMNHESDKVVGPDMGVSVTPETSASVTEMQDTEAGTLDSTLQFEGDYVAACVEEDILYMLQKTSIYELYIVNLADVSEWKKINPEIPDEEVIIKLEWNMDEVYAVNEQGKKYACPIEN